MMLRAALFLAVVAAPALADEPRAPKMPPPAREPHVSAYGAQNASCLEWTNACVTCARAQENGRMGAAHCSTPGIACTPGKVTCTRP